MAISYRSSRKKRRKHKTTLVVPSAYKAGDILVMTIVMDGHAKIPFWKRWIWSARAAWDRLRGRYTWH